jgi:hypothetical protein
MTAPKKKLLDEIPAEDRQRYSLNFLVAAFDPIDDFQRDEALLLNHLPSRHYWTRDFSTHPFHKSISTPLADWGALIRDDE